MLPGGLPDAGDVNGLLESLIQLRAQFRKGRNFKLSDAIRANLDRLGIVLEDGPAGTTWRFREK
jgi:cysteinyl-tRNA synthetase